MQKLFIKNRYNQKICVVVNEQPGEKLVFIEHGLGGFKEQVHLQALESVFFQNGYTTVLFDTTNSIGESDGEYEKATLGGSYEDLQDVVNWAKTQQWYREPFTLSGFSMGGYSVVQFAEDYPTLVSNLVAGAPVVSGELSKATDRAEELAEWQKTGWKTRISNSKPGLELRLPWSHMEERLTHDLLPKADQLTMPTLIIVGSEDISCPVEHQKILFEKIPSKIKKLAIVKGAPHSFRLEGDIHQLKIEVDNWLKNLQ